MVLSINQPAYLPWLGYFDRIARSDLHIVLDNVQIERNTSTSFTNRNKIRTAQGWTWLTVPVRRGSTQEKNEIRNVLVDGSHWTRKHWRTLSQSYARAPYFTEHSKYLEHLYGSNWPRLGPLLRESTTYLLRVLGIQTPIRYSSELPVVGSKGELVLKLCESVRATRYLSGPLGRDYIDETRFASAGIAVEYHDYIHPNYSQLHGVFLPYMSVVDLVFNHGNAALRVLSGSRL